jgi:hypothetical protein
MILWYVLCDPQLTHRSCGRELGQEGMCNRVRDRYEEKVARTLAQTTHSSRCGRQLCHQHERSNMWYQRKLIKNTYSTTAYAGLTARRDLPRFIVYHSDVMWPYYNKLGLSRAKSRTCTNSSSCIFRFPITCSDLCGLPSLHFVCIMKSYCAMEYPDEIDQEMNELYANCIVM